MDACEQIGDLHGTNRLLAFFPILHYSVISTLCSIGKVTVTCDGRHDSLYLNDMIFSSCVEK